MYVFIAVSTQTANFVVRAEDIPPAILSCASAQGAQTRVKISSAQFVSGKYSKFENKMKF
jgi:hypothetical protein